MVSRDETLTTQAEALAGIERDYLNQVMVLLDDVLHDAPPKLDHEVIAAIIG